MPLRAFLFDFDGVLADTENVHVAAWQRTLAALGWEVDDAVCARAVEVDDRAFLADLFATRRIENGELDGWLARKQELTVSLLGDSPRLYPGVARLVEALRGRVRLAIVTTTWRANVAAVLDASGLADAFDLVVAKEDVAAVKPDPECYRLALQRLGIAPGEALALEDSPTGLDAARAAGVRLLAVGHRRPQGDWTIGADYLADLTQTAALLARWKLT